MTRKGVLSLPAVVWVWVGRGSPLQSAGRTLGVTFVHSLMTRAGVNGAGSLSNWQGSSELQLSSGGKGPVLTKPTYPAQSYAFSGCFSRFQKERRGAEREGVVFMPLASFA